MSKLIPKTPKLWKNKSLISDIMMPLSALYGFVQSSAYSMKKTDRVDVPVICVGNLTAGGGGKTPTSIYLATKIKKLGYNPVIISRGYGGSIKKSTKIDLAIHSSSDVGDEPLLLARHATCIIGRDRLKSAQNALQMGADILLMDDGLQNPSLHKDLKIIAVDGGYGFGNGRLIPAGPLRESVADGITKSDLAIIIGNDDKDAVEQIKKIDAGFNIVSAKMVIDLKNIDETREYIAFAGIARPEKFYDSLSTAGVKIIENHDFPDHHQYSESELSDLIKRAKERKAQLITTEKDGVRIGEKFKSDINVARASLIVDKNEEIIDKLLEKLLDDEHP